MGTKNKVLEKVIGGYREISLLSKINSVLSWDQSVNLPTDASAGRAEQIAYLTEKITEKWLDSEFKEGVDVLRETAINNNEIAVVRNLDSIGKYYWKVPKKLIVEIAETSAKAFMAWQEARKNDDFKIFKPYLETLVGYNRKVVNYLGYFDNPYDALLNIYEPNLTASKVKDIFKVLQPELTNVLKKIEESKVYIETEKNNLKDSTFSVEEQKKLANYILEKMNYDFSAGRMDISTHPFTETLGGKDVRITNRYKEDDFVESMMVVMHEGGHALYEQGVDEKYEGTPLEGGTSLGIHESQSRFWENQIGRSLAFLKFIESALLNSYPKQLAGHNAKKLYKEFNKVKPSLIRTEADEVTYNLHIALRFELEEALINNKIKVKDLPEIWREKMQEYLGVMPKTDREGVLQDVHWSHDLMGYFPTYTLGNLYSAQFTMVLKKELNLEKLVEKGEWGEILSWLRKNIHQYGALYPAEELVKKVTNESLDSKYFLDYIKEKYSSIYSVNL